VTILIKTPDGTYFNRRRCRNRAHPSGGTSNSASRTTPYTLQSNGSLNSIQDANSNRIPLVQSQGQRDSLAHSTQCLELRSQCSCLSVKLPSQAAALARMSMTGGRLTQVTGVTVRSNTARDRPTLSCPSQSLHPPTTTQHTITLRFRRALNWLNNGDSSQRVLRTPGGYSVPMLTTSNPIPLHDFATFGRP